MNGNYLILKAFLDNSEKFPFCNFFLWAAAWPATNCNANIQKNLS
jgi:hypothetical protein